MFDRRARRCQPRLPVARGQHSVSLAGKVVGECAQQGWVIFNDENCCAFGSRRPAGGIEDGAVWAAVVISMSEAYRDGFNNSSSNC